MGRPRWSSFPTAPLPRGATWLHRGPERAGERPSVVRVNPRKEPAPFQGTTRVSVVIPTLNAQRYVDDTLRSLCAQTANNVEIIVVDGGSTDATLERIREYPDICLIEGSDSSYLEALWKGIAIARGEYIMQSCMSDMLVDAEWLATACAYLDSHPEVSLAWGINGLADESGRLIDVCVPTRFLPGLPDPRQLFEFWLLTGYAVSETNFLVRRQVLLGCLPRADEPLIATVDPWLEFNFRFHSSGFQAGSLPRVASVLRLHEDSNLSAEQSSGLFDRRLDDYLAKVLRYRNDLLCHREVHRPISPTGVPIEEPPLSTMALRRAIINWWIQDRVASLGVRVLEAVPGGIRQKARARLRQLRIRMTSR